MLVTTCAVAAALYLAGVANRWEPTPDSALYLSLARSLERGQGYTFNGQPDNTVTPGLPWVLAAMRRAFGPEFLAPNLFVVLCALGALALAYRSISILSDRRTALAATIGTAASYVYFFNAHCVLTDLPFTLLFWALFYCSLRVARGMVVPAPGGDSGGGGDHDSRRADF